MPEEPYFKTGRPMKQGEYLKNLLECFQYDIQEGKIKQNKEEQKNTYVGS